MGSLIECTHKICDITNSFQPVVVQYATYGCDEETLSLEPTYTHNGLLSEMCLFLVLRDGADIIFEFLTSSLTFFEQKHDCVSYVCWEPLKNNAEQYYYIKCCLLLHFNYFHYSSWLLDDNCQSWMTTRVCVGYRGAATLADTDSKGLTDADKGAESDSVPVCVVQAGRYCIIIYCTGYWFWQFTTANLSAHLTLDSCLEWCYLRTGVKPSQHTHLPPNTQRGHTRTKCVWAQLSWIFPSQDSKVIPGGFNRSKLLPFYHPAALPALDK